MRRSVPWRVGSDHRMDTVASGPSPLVAVSISKFLVLYDSIYIALKCIKMLTLFNEEDFCDSSFLDGDGKENITCRF